jgi:putative hydrolase of the HAD superfamily
MIIVFDLDDTLYEEISYVKSGFRAVADYFEQRCSIPAEESFSFMLERLKGGRGKIFDDLLFFYNIFSRERVKKCLSIYRGHFPNITLYPEADIFLRKFVECPIYIVTDGNKLVQQKKLAALEIENRVKFSFITHRYGKMRAKPSPYCFLKIAEWEKALPEDIVYVGDNPYKDFVGIKPLGFRTVRILQGNFKDIRLAEEFEAQRSIHSLTELTEEFLEELFIKQ